MARSSRESDAILSLVCARRSDCAIPPSILSGQYVVRRDVVIDNVNTNDIQSSRIFVPFVQKGQGIVRPITARPMTDGEKRLYRKKRGKR